MGLFIELFMVIVMISKVCEVGQEVSSLWEVIHVYSEVVCV